MRKSLWLLMGGFVAIRGLLGFPAQAAESDGGRLYRMHCASCHGPTGKGDGPDAAIFTAPLPDLREGFLARYSTEELVRRVGEGRPFDVTLDPGALRARAGEVEAVVAHLKRLPSINWQLVQRGRAIYADRCDRCHGPSGRPNMTMLPPGVRTPCDLSEIACQRSISDHELTTAVRHGHQHMPALVPRIAKEDAPPLAAFVRLLSPGYELYHRYCASCHGDDGRGRASAAETRQRPSVVFDRRYFTRRDPEQLRASIWHMVTEQQPTMPHYRATLNEAQARAIIEYLKATEK